jgi:hypothetical protein
MLTADKSLRSKRLKHAVIEAINLLIEEIESCYDDIAEQAVEHIHQKHVSSFNLKCKEQNILLVQNLIIFFFVVACQ